MKEISCSSGWLRKRLEAMSKNELCELFEEIAKFHKIGVLESNNQLRKLEKEFSDNVSHTPYNQCLKLVEDAVLFEIGRRYYNESLEG